MKETFFIQHDYNSRNDEKILKLRKKLGAEGVGLFWMICEKLAESSEARLKLSDVDLIAYELQADSERIADVVLNYELFKNDKTYFWSNRLLSDIEARNEKSAKASLAAKIRWSKLSQKNADAMQTHSVSNAIAMQGKERKERKERKDNTMRKEDFARFWEMYPVKKSRMKAETAFMRLSAELLPKILHALELQKKSDPWTRDGGKFIPYPTTWINGSRWDDELESAIKKAPKIGQLEYYQQKSNP